MCYFQRPTFTLPFTCHYFFIVSSSSFYYLPSLGTYAHASWELESNLLPGRDMASSWCIKLAFKCLLHIAWYANAINCFILPLHPSMHANQHYPCFISFYFLGLFLLWCFLCKFLFSVFHVIKKFLY